MVRVDRSKIVYPLSMDEVHHFLYNVTKKDGSDGGPFISVDELPRERVEKSGWGKFDPGRKPGFHNPDLQCLGPTEYDLKSLQLWYHPLQDPERQMSEVLRVPGDRRAIGDTMVEAWEIYDYICQQGDLENHIGYADLLAIQRKGTEVRRLFGKNRTSRVLLAWKSIWDEGLADSRVPGLQLEDDNTTYLRWFPLFLFSSKFNENYFGLRFPKSAISTGDTKLPK